jgi:hypothetical protein
MSPVGVSPSLRQDIVNAGLSPKNVAPVSSAGRHWKARSGQIGLRSIIKIDQRVSSAETSACHITQADGQRAPRMRERGRVELGRTRLGAELAPGGHVREGVAVPISAWHMHDRAE